MPLRFTGIIDTPGGNKVPHAVITATMESSYITGPKNTRIHNPPRLRVNGRILPGETRIAAGYTVDPITGTETWRNGYVAVQEGNSPYNISFPFTQGDTIVKYALRNEEGEILYFPVPFGVNGKVDPKQLSEVLYKKEAVSTGRFKGNEPNLSQTPSVLTRHHSLGTVKTELSLTEEINAEENKQRDLKTALVSKANNKVRFRQPNQKTQQKDSI